MASCTMRENEKCILRSGEKCAVGSELEKSCSLHEKEEKKPRPKKK